MMWTVAFCVLIGLGTVCCRVTVRPQNTVAIRGKRTSLECRTTNGSVVLDWSFVPSSNPTEVRIFNNWDSRSQQLVMAPGFGIEADNFGSGILFKNETRFEDGGKYICTTDADEQITRSSAELIVLDSKPVCSVIKYDSRNIMTECSVGFSGNWAPRMEWRHHSRRREAHEDGTLFLSGTGNETNRTHATSTLNVVLYSARDSLSVSCKIFFDARDHLFPSGSATNVPDFVDIWTSRVFEEDFAPDVDASPTTPGLVVVSSTLSGQSTDAIVQSKVAHGTESRSSHALSGDGDSDSGKNDSWYWILILAGGGGVLAIVLISLVLGAIICIIRKRKSKEKRKGNVDVIYRKKTGEVTDPNIYDSILLSDENGYRIPLQELNDEGSPAYGSPKEVLDPYYVTTSTELSTSTEAEKILRPRHKDDEAKATSTEYERIRKPSEDNVDSAKLSKEQDPASPKLSEDNYVEVGNDKSAYLQVIYDIEDRQDGEIELPSNKGSELAPLHSDAYTRLVLE